MGAIADRLADSNPTRTRKGPPCTVCSLIADSDEDDVRLLESWLSDDRRRYSQIAEELHDKGIGTYESRTLARHARGECWLMRQQGRRLR